MDAAIKKKKTTLVIAIILTLGLPLGIVITVICAVNKIWILMALGIVLTVAGFYGAPICWARMADYNKTLTLLRAVEEQNLYTVSELRRGRVCRGASSYRKMRVLRKSIFRIGQSLQGRSGA